MGLNIVEAQHVLMVDPCMNPAMHMQAIGRVHRIGQTKETTVYQFVVRDSIEERIVKLQDSKKRAMRDQQLARANCKENDGLLVSDIVDLFKLSQVFPV